MTIPSRMHAAIFDRCGSPDVLDYREVPTPSPGPDDVLIEVRATGLNHLDLWVRRGLPIDTTMPHIGGSDIAGRVAAIGTRVSDWNVGDDVLVNPALSCGHCPACRSGDTCLCRRFRILGEHTDGGFSDFAVAPAANLYSIPDGWSFLEAASIGISYQTAWRALIARARLRPGEDLLVIGASGGTAIAAIQIARLAGARIFALTSGSENVRRLNDLGVYRAYDRLEVDFAALLAADTGKRGVDVVLENVGEPTWESSVRSLANGGRLVTYGATAGPIVQVDIRRLFWKQIELIGTTMATVAEFEAMLKALTANDVRPVVDRSFTLAQAADAHRYLEAGNQFGNVILTPDVPSHPA